MLEKLALAYDPVEDRLVLTLRIRGASAIQRRVLALTRRVCAAWRGDLHAMLELAEREPQSVYVEQQPARAAPAAAGSAPASGSDRSAAGSSEPADDDAAEPTVELVTRITCARRRADGRWVLKFQLRGGNPFSLTMSDKALGDLATALERRVKAARWGLPPLKDPGRAAVPQPRHSLH